jgi:hypothetical protein
LMPSTMYPFAAGTTLVYGAISHAGAALPGAIVRKAGDPGGFVTEDDGRYVLAFDSVAGLSETITLRASHAALADTDVSVTLSRGMTVSKDIAM